MLDADRPILTKEQDRLGRAIFAKYLARSILDHKNTESLVIGLYGGWGSGKTSLINLTLEELHIAASNMFDDEKPIILNFSPWSYSGQNQLIFSFFRRLSSELRRAEYLEHADKIIYLLELYISFFTHQPIPQALRAKPSFFSRLFKRNRNDIQGWESGRDLTLVKAELNQTLCELKNKIVIFIDNVSRIEDAEIKQIFQIVKSMGDYANTVYVLAMDKKIILQAMNKIHGKQGEEFLEKVVQLPFEIPNIPQHDLENLLLARLKSIVNLVPEEAWNKEYWADIYYSTLKYFFKNARDITRYVNTLGFSFPRVKEVVNPVDFFAITAIEVFAPEVFYGIRDNKDLFTDLAEQISELDKAKSAEEKLRCDEVINRSTTISQQDLIELLIHLFPRLRNFYQSKKIFFHSEILARKNLRICSPDMFDIYFRLSIPAGYISEAEMHAILSLAANEENFALGLLRLNQDERVTKFLDLLDSFYVHQIPTTQIENVITALIDSADLFPPGESNQLEFNSAMRLHRIFHQLLCRVDPGKRFAIFSNAIKKATKSIYIIVHELNVQQQEHQETEDTFIPKELHYFTLEQLQNLRELTVKQIQYWAKIGRLIEHPKLIPILYAWKAWGNETDVREFVEQAVREQIGLLAFLCTILQEPIDQTITKLEKKSWEKYLLSIEDFIPASFLVPHAKMIFEDTSFETLREREQLAILIFLDLLQVNTTKIMPKTTL